MPANLKHTWNRYGRNRVVLDYYDILSYDEKGLCINTTATYSMNPENKKICLEMQRRHDKAYIDAVRAGKTIRMSWTRNEHQKQL